MYLLHEFDTPRQKVPMRQRHFRTAMVVLSALALSHIPLYKSVYEVTEEQSALTFFVRGTLMHIGTQPFALADMAVSLVDKEDKNGRMYGLGLAMCMALHWVYTTSQHWICAVQLVTVAIAMANAMNYLDVYGSISLSTALIFCNASARIITTFFTPSTLVILALVGIISWLHGLVVTVPLTHTRRRTQTISMELPVMYNSTTALILYTTLTETLATFTPKLAVLNQRSIEPSTLLTAACLFGAVYFINKQLPEVQQTRGRDMITAWTRDNYAIKGWHSKKRMSLYVQRLVERNVWWNTVIICALWAVALVCRPAVLPSTIFILTSTAKQYVNQPLLSWRD